MESVLRERHLWDLLVTCDLVTFQENYGCS